MDRFVVEPESTNLSGGACLSCRWNPRRIELWVGSRQLWTLRERSSRYIRGRSDPSRSTTDRWRLLTNRSVRHRLEQNTRYLLPSRDQF